MVHAKRIQHVSLPRPPGLESAEVARQFYVGLLGLQEIPLPSTISASDLVWFQLGDQELHLFSEDLPVDKRMTRHLCIEFEDIDSVRALLTEQGFVPEEAPRIPNRPRFFCRDPFGNNIEFMMIKGDYK